MRRIFIKVRIYLILLAGIFAASCTSEYQRKVDQELASGERYDSLFLGVEFGMSREEFYKHCWELNRQELVIQGDQNTTVQYDLDELKFPAELNFYPDFHEDKIFQMPTTFAYKAWAPWNKNLSADSLQLDVLELLKDWYGDDFIRVESKDRGVAFVRVDGNRRITLYKPDERDVHVLFTDLTVENQLKEMKSDK